MSDPVRDGGSFERRSRFTTWAYTVATRSLLRMKKRFVVRAWIEPVAKQLDDVVAIGDVYRFDRFKAVGALWRELQGRFPQLLDAG